MPLPRVYETEAIIIRKMNLGEADRLLTLYTPSLGKVKAVAKGVRRPKSKLGGNVEILTYSRLLLARGRNLDIITQGQTIDSFMSLKANLQRASWALYAAELTDRFTPERVASPLLFELLIETLKRLGSENRSELALRYFEIHLLESSGYRPQLSHCPDCNAVLSSTARLSFSPVAGGLLCTECRTSEPEAYSLSSPAIMMLGRLQDDDFNTLPQEELSPGLSSEIGRALREYISYILEGKVKSAAWLSHLKGMEKTWP